MAQSLTLRLFEIVGSPLCVASDDGQKVHDQLAQAIGEDRHVKLSFPNITGLTSAFLNTAVGQLCRAFPPEQIRESLSVEDIEPDDLALLKRVVDTAKDYFSDRERFEEAERVVLRHDRGDWRTMGKARDIRQHSFSDADALLFDANVWLDIYGPQSDPAKSRVRVYSGVLKDIELVGSKVHVDVLVMSEFVNRYARLEYYHVPQATRPGPVPTNGHWSDA